MIFKDPTIANSLPGWWACDAALAKFTPPASFGFPCDAGVLNRFSSRYRLARSFQGIQLNEYSKDTADGYSAIFHVFLAYSAFEQLLDCCGIKLNALEPRLASYGVTGVEAKIRSVERFDAFFIAVHEHLDRENQRKQIEAFLAGSPFNLLYLPAGVRHIFAHGKLTPNSGSADPQSAVKISAILVEFLFTVMDGEFTSRLYEHGVLS